ncbi:hypothetical protein [Bradyrhizobium sp. BWA-3-5]|uniref:Mom family adenine methylcarbamoylation protein n=1 Tax=Bradyrhizobium sp. BWA-3-5 TaxID=3080013 RepID=UPI00293EB256|nr:hypothetical protein [Bradyrhizobium sp. BWA-3-5]WOH63604.1 hypothetical protein RX331_23070 [Bradyrhizobium sp. BWA-3-5]
MTKIDIGAGFAPANDNDQKLKKNEWFVADAGLRAAQEMVRQHHYSRGGSNTAVYVHGLFRRGDFKLYGVAWWLPPTRVACESVNREYWKQVLSLTRMVILPGVPKNAASFLLSRSVQMIRRDGRFVSLVTYADESQGHTGHVYRASNWDYIGRTGPYPRWLDADGRQVAPKATTNRTKAQMLALGHRQDGSFHKYKFVLHLPVKKIPANDNEPAQLNLVDSVA